MYNAEEIIKKPHEQNEQNSQSYKFVFWAALDWNSFNRLKESQNDLSFIAYALQVCLTSASRKVTVW